MNEISKQINKYTVSGEKSKAPARFKVLADCLGIPDKNAKYIHVAGTNGKGSVCEFIATALNRETRPIAKVGKFTSPFLTDINERIAVNNHNISDEDITKTYRKVDAAADKCGVVGFSQFEILTAVALLHFKNEKVDYAVIETGIGGLLDCTNIITPAVSVITKVSVDHVDILGGTLTDIAVHKAGIVKPGVPVVTDPNQDGEVMEVIRETARRNGSDLIIPDLKSLDVIRREIFGSEMKYKKHSLRINMGGEYQIYNAITAVEALDVLGVHPSFLDARIPARLQVITENPFVVVDGAHNPESLSCAREAVLQAIDSEDIIGKKFIVVGMLRSKDYREGLKSLIFPGACVVLTDGFSEEAVPVGELKKICHELGAKKVYSVHMTAGAIDLAWYLAGFDGLVLICGSLYLAGEALKHFRYDIGYCGI